MIVITIIATFVNLCSRWMATKAVNQTQVTVRRRVFEHAVNLPLHRVYDMKSGGVASLIREDAGGVADLIFSMLYNPWRAIVQFVGSLVILMFVDWKLMVGGLLSAAGGVGNTSHMDQSHSAPCTATFANSGKKSTPARRKRSAESASSARSREPQRIVSFHP